MAGELPIDALRGDFTASIRMHPVAITAPTGTGKSTQVPRWLYPDASAEHPVLVIQPRRVAARAVAARIAELEGLELGREVGYRVRDDNRTSALTRLLVVTPGIVLSRPELLSRASVVVLDELHERRLDTDLIFALLAKEGAPFVAMSATMDGDAVARAVNGRHLHVATRTYPVEIEHFDSSADLPSAEQLERRVALALQRLPEDDGDVLVFLPGKGEIERVAASLEQHGPPIVRLHGGLNLKEQAQALRSSKRRRVILSTNVAETSLTIPGVTAVIDAGLVRRTSYHNGRSYLKLAAIARDSADQRAGRAGRVAKGSCIRLWGRQARLQGETPPEIYREELSSLVMTCAALSLAPERLPFLDAPRQYALDDARKRLTSLGALSHVEAGTAPHLTVVGKELLHLPLDPWLSRVLVEAKKTGCLAQAVDLVALLEQPAASSLAKLAPAEELENAACDAEALLFMVREGKGESAPQRRALSEARASSRRLRQALSAASDRTGSAANQTAALDRTAPLDRNLLLKTFLQAFPSCAHVARTRKKRIVFSNGGTEMEVGRESRVAHLLGSDNPRDRIDALVVLETHGVSSGKDHKLLITVASPIPLSWLAQLELGTVSAKQAKRAKSGPYQGSIVVTLERSFAGRVIETREVLPRGKHAREAVVQLYAQGSLYPTAQKEARRRLARRALAVALADNPDFAHFKGSTTAPELKAWLLSHLEQLGVESGEDLEMLSESDFIPEDVPAELAPQLDDRFPLEVDLGDSLYAAEYNLPKRQVTLSIVRGGRKTPPPPAYLPRFEGLKVFIEAGGSYHQVRR